MKCDTYSEILVLGSVVNDIVFLPKGKTKEFFGGTGANISYGLGLLGLHPTLFSVVGSDFGSKFKSHLEKHGINLALSVNKKNKTATFLIDKTVKGATKETWQPNVYNEIENISLLKAVKKPLLQKIKIAVFSPGTAKSTLRHLKEFRAVNKNAFVIFDPGQMIYTYSKKVFLECLEYSDMLIINEFETEFLEDVLKLNLKKILDNKIFIKTLGEKGSTIYTKDDHFTVPVFKAKKFIDATGAGDAYRAGLIYGIVHNYTLLDGAKLGAKIASKNVEHLGCQNYTFKVKLIDIN